MDIDRDAAPIVADREAIVFVKNDFDLAAVACQRLVNAIINDFDKKMVKTAQIRAFPTTWFIDPDGRVQFSAIGNTGALVEEWSWRLEALRAAASAVPVP